MLYKNTLIFTLILLFFSTLSCVSIENEDFTTNGSLSEDAITYGGYQREYITYEPSRIDKNKAVPLLLVLHGGGGTNEGMMRLIKNRFNGLANIHKFYVVYPQGLEKGWNDGRDDLEQFSSKNNIDDVGFLKNLFIHYSQNIILMKTKY